MCRNRDTVALSIRPGARAALCVADWAISESATVGCCSGTQSPAFGRDRVFGHYATSGRCKNPRTSTEPYSVAKSAAQRSLDPHSGCRSSELASISLDARQPNRIDLQAGLITITDAKYDSRGTIPLDASSLRIIRHYVREVGPKIRNAAVMHQLFLTKTGSPYNSNKLTKKMRMLLSRYGLTQGRIVRNVLPGAQASPA